MIQKDNFGIWMSCIGLHTHILFFSVLCYQNKNFTLVDFLQKQNFSKYQRIKSFNLRIKKNQKVTG
jgi:hypothetical protein